MRRKRTNGLVMSKKSRKLLPFNPVEDPVRRLEQIASLAAALTTNGIEFSDELTCIAGMAPRSANCAALERDRMPVPLKLSYLMVMELKFIAFRTMLLQSLLR